MIKCLLASCTSFKHNILLHQCIQRGCNASKVQHKSSVISQSNKLAYTGDVVELENIVLSLFISDRVKHRDNVAQVGKIGVST